MKFQCTKTGRLADTEVTISVKTSVTGETEKLSLENIIKDTAQEFASAIRQATESRRNFLQPVPPTKKEG